MAHSVSDYNALVQELYDGRVTIIDNIKNNITDDGIRSQVPQDLALLKNYLVHIIGSLEKFMTDVCGFSSVPSYFVDSLTLAINAIDSPIYKKEGGEYGTLYLTDDNKAGITDNSGILYMPKIDLNALTSFNQVFKNNTGIREIVGIDLSQSSATNFRSFFEGCANLINGDKITFPESTINGMLGEKLFYNCKSMLTAPKIKAKFSSSVFNMFRNCVNLKSIDTRDWDMSTASNMDNAFNGCVSLESLIGGVDSTTGVTCLNGLKYNTDFSSLASLDRPSLLALFRGLDSTASGRTLKISNTAYSRLEEGDTDIIPSGWTLQHV